MKAILEFNLPDDGCPHIIAVHAMDWALMVSELDETLRRWLKYGHNFEYPEEALQALRDTLHEGLVDRLISLDMIE